MPHHTTFLGALLAAALLIPAAGAQDGLQIAVVEGQGAQNSIERGLGAPIVVELRDASGAPVPRAEVTFRSPSQGPSGTFFGASHLSKAWTDDDGRAQAASLTPNTLPGDYTIVVQAQHQGASASAEIRQTNVGPTPDEPKKKRRIGPKIWIPIAVGVVIAIIGFARGGD